MKKEARVLIIDRDLYDQSWKALLLARDWRTRVAGELSSLSEIPAYYQERKQKRGELPNIILLNDDLLVPGEAQSLKIEAIRWQLEQIYRLPGSPAVLIIGETPNAFLMRALPFPGFCGYLLKPEIGHSLGWAVALADPSRWVITPGVEAFFHHKSENNRITILTPPKNKYQFTDYEALVARMSVIFSMERGDMSDEIKITTPWVYGLISVIYRKIGLDEIFSGEADISEYLDSHFMHIPRFQKILQRIGKAKKRADQETLAFHILTKPDTEDWR